MQNPGRYTRIRLDDLKHMDGEFVYVHTTQGSTYAHVQVRDNDEVWLKNSYGDMLLAEEIYYDGACYLEDKEV